MFSKSYDSLCNLSIEKPEEFWHEIAQELKWNKPYSSVLENKFSPLSKWFVGGEINMSYNCLDRHVEEGYGEDVAVIHDSPITGSTRSITYSELLTSVELLAGVMVDRCGMKKGDIALIFFPMIPEGFISMLACTRIGVTYVVVYGGYSSKELAVRLQNTEPKLILTCNVGPEPGNLVNYKEKLDIALSLCTFSPRHCIVYNRPHFKCAKMRDEIDLDFMTEIHRATPHGPVPLDSSHPMYIIYTSGTTGEPKGLVLNTGGSIVYNIYVGKYILGIEPNETFWSLSDFGWTLGQTALTYVPLLLRAKTVLFEGKIVKCPDNSQFCRVINWHKVRIIFSSPTGMRMVRRYCSKTDLELSYKRLKYIIVGGELSDRCIREWLSETFNCKVFNCWGQTETGGILMMSWNAMQDGTKFKLDNTSLIKTPGINIKVVDKDTGVEVPPGTFGRIVMAPTFVPSLSQTFYKNQERFLKTYFETFPGYYDTMDVGRIKEDLSLKVESRDDDVIHVGAARICGLAVEDACLGNPDVFEVIAVGLKDEMLGQVAFAFLVRATGSNKSDCEIISDTIFMVKDTIGEVTGFKDAVIIPDFPKTRSGKIHRQSLFDMLNGIKSKVPSIVINEHVYPTIHSNLINAGYKSKLPT